MLNLENLIGRLTRAKVDFVVIGGFAAVAHGATRVTQDVDVCCDFAADNLLRLQAALADIHPAHRMPPSRPPLELTTENAAAFKNLYLDTDEGQLDCLSVVDGVGDFVAAREQSIEISLAAGTCRVLSLDALINAKEATGRPHDLQTATELRAIRERRRSG